jgi:hypothetical protein
MEKYEKVHIDTKLIPKVEARILAATFLDAVLRFYENPENMAGFERWQAERREGKNEAGKN